MEEVKGIFEAQVKRLQESQFLVLYWAAESEGRGVKYNITNAFDDLKSAGLTRTKQTAVASVMGLETLCFIDLREEHNRKNIYITNFGAQALKEMVVNRMFEAKKSSFLMEVSK